MNNRLVMAAVIFGVAAGCIPSGVFTQELYQFILHDTAGMTAEDCKLIERYYRKDEKRLAFPGTFDPAAGCLVTMSFAEYDERFAFCYLAGSGRHYASASQSTECFVQKTADEYIFLAHVDREVAVENSQIACYFSCIGKSGKDD